MALPQWYCDFTNGNDTTGVGTSGNPWKTVAGSLLNIQNATNGGTGQGASGDQLNMKAGGTDLLAAVLPLTTYVPSATKPLIIRGYTSAANDGGIGDLSGNASVGIVSFTGAGLHLRDLHLHNCGAANIITVNTTAGNTVDHCEVDTTTGSGISNVIGSLVINSYLHDIGTGMVVNGGPVMFNRFETLTKNPTSVISANNILACNTIAITGSALATVGINFANANTHCFGNSLWSNGGKTNAGIQPSASTRTGCSIFSNIVEGWSGTGGKGIIDNAAPLSIEGNNFLFNNATATSFTVANGGPIIQIAADTTTGSSNFNNPTGSPPDLSLSAAGITACKGKAYPGAWVGGTGFSTASPFTSYPDAGAVQHQDAGGGGTNLNRASYPSGVSPVG